MKICSKCSEMRPLSEYWRDSNRKDNLCPQCKHCMRSARRRQGREAVRKHKLKHRYGITPEQFDALNESQGGLCKICGKPPTASRKNLDIDHCHKTGLVRGLLCNPCNKAIGVFKDDPQLLKSAINYLNG